MHHQRHHVEVGAVEGREALVGGLFLFPAFREREADTVVLLLVFLEMILGQSVETLASDGGQRQDVFPGGIAADVVVVDEVGGGGDINGGRCGIAYAHALLAVDHLTVGLHTDATLCLKPGRDAFLFHTLDEGGQLVAIHLTGGS